ncbi:MAG: arsenate reductase ArsC [Anaerolineales bacterium]|jgi:arsenate reductase
MGIYNKRSVLFLCSGNSCRSQIAEALTNAYFSEDWQAFSAGTQPVGFIHPTALKVLEEIGISHQGRSKSLQEVLDLPYDLVVTVCDAADRDCPTWLGQGKRVHHSFKDPASIEGTPAEIHRAFQNTRDDILAQLPRILGNVRDQEE